MVTARIQPGQGTCATPRLSHGGLVDLNRAGKFSRDGLAGLRTRGRFGKGAELLLTVASQPLRASA